MPPSGVAMSTDRWGWASLEPGTDDEPTHGGDQGDAIRYRSASKGAKAVILNELCATIRWHRDHAHKALRESLGPRRVPVPRNARLPTYGEDVMVALARCAVMDAPEGKRMAPFLPRSRPAAGLSRAGRPGHDRGEAVRDVGGHDRSPDGR